MKIQSYLTATEVNRKPLAARWCSAYIRLLEGLCRPQKPNARSSRSLAPLGLALRRRVSRHTTRFRIGLIQQPLERELPNSWLSCNS